MIPNDFVLLDEFPLTPNGKVNRQALPRPDFAREALTTTPARDELEAMLLSVWKRVLGTSSIGVTDNFFEVGGHSLLAVRLIAEIEKLTGREIPLATLFRGATVEYLADVVRQGGTLPHQTILAIHERGSEIPFFGIVTPGMNALGYIPLARHLGSNQPVYRIQGPGSRLKGRSYSKAEFEKLAAAYIEAMKSVQPEGPYYLGGMCEGARIAFDMARLLEARGEEVGLLAIFDTWVLENSQNRFLWKIDYYSGRVKRFNALPFAEKARFVGEWFRKRVDPLPHAPQPEGSDWPSMYWPGKNFVPAKFGGRITVFKNPKQAYFYVRDPLMGWGTRTTVGVEIHEVNTKHGFFMREPYVRDLADKLSACLRRSRTQPTVATDHPTDAETFRDRFVLSGDRVSS
jgi:thioesterase domain-containing protein